MKYYLIDFEDGSYKYGYFISYSAVLDWVEMFLFDLGNRDLLYTIAEYDSEDDYFNSL